MKPLVAILILLVPLPAFGGLISEPFVGQVTEDFDDAKVDAPGVTVVSGYIKGNHPWLMESDALGFGGGGVTPGVSLAEFFYPGATYAGLAFLFDTPVERAGFVWKGSDAATISVRARLIGADGSTLEEHLLDVAPGKFFGFDSLAGMSRLEIGSVSQDGNAVLMLDDLTYSVPEPSTVGLLAIGMVWLLGRRRR